MSGDRILTRVTEVVAAAARVEPRQVRAEAALQSMGIDSVHLLSVIVTLEDEFAITFDATELGELSCRSLADSIVRSTAARA